MESIKSPHVTLLAGLVLCVAAVILVICKIEDNRKNRNSSFANSLGESISTVETNQLMDRGTPRSARRQRSARSNLDVLERLGFILTADDIGDHKAKGRVQIIDPDGTVLRSESMSISSDGDYIFLHGWISATNKSGFVRRYLGADSFAKIALDGSSHSIIGTPLYEPGSTFNAPYKVNSVIELSPNQEGEQASDGNGGQAR